MGTSKLEFRKQRAGPVRERMRAWLNAQKERHPPKSPIAAAIRYAETQWNELGVYVLAGAAGVAKLSASTRVLSD